ncbi:hypothetical protein CEW83_02345 [Parazoarcus communis]|uniref:KfrA N-terminal DNA-binding domain-containing protein n=1 Tax=Parazoarcus communis TaxID=41977 RepID=A0A2U8GLZ0_9RHOO|nr:DNA-binding protein [Parazoarcus communis]AWI74203.1 hypothetical protein CEW83_02345 [Parazoarcus communis]
MRQTTITAAEVRGHAEQMLARGEHPTARAMRAALGRGSMDTILRFLNEWSEVRERQKLSPVTLPEEIERGIQSYLVEQVSRETAGLRLALDASRRDNSDLLAESADLLARFEMREQEIQRLQDHLSKSDGQLSLIRQELSEWQLRALTAAEEAAALRAKVKDAEALSAKVAELQSNLESERTSRMAAEVIELRRRLARPKQRSASS